ncbi:MAG TPA: AI-2E family transporter [Fimbriimonas sp.]|nr:AI-2E family transporter [Fimbriimonas sp.]
MSSPEPKLDPSQAQLPTPEQQAIEFSKWRRLLVSSATVLCLFAICAIAIRLGLAIHHTLLLFTLGGLIAYALAPLVDLVQRPRLGKAQRPLGKTASVFVVFAFLFLVLAGILWWLGEHAAHQIKVLRENGPAYHNKAINLAQDFDERFLKPKGIEFSVADTIQNPPREVNTYASKIGESALPYIAHTVVNITESFVVLLIALYFLIFGTEMKEQANRAMSPFLRTYAEPWETDVNRILGGFVRGQFAVALINGACAAVGLLAFGVHLWLILAAFVVIASLIPVFGTYLGAVPAIIAALVTPTHFTPVAGAISVLILFIVINEVSSKIFYPKLVGAALNLHEVLVLFVLFAGLEIDGIVGALLAAPIASLSIVTLVHLYRLWQESPEEPISDEIMREYESKPHTRVFKRRKPTPAKG